MPKKKDNSINIERAKTLSDMSVHVGADSQLLRYSPCLACQSTVLIGKCHQEERPRKLMVAGAPAAVRSSGWFVPPAAAAPPRLELAKPALIGISS